MVKANVSHVGTNPGSKEVLQSSKALEAPEKQEMGTVQWGDLGNWGFALPPEERQVLCAELHWQGVGREGREDWLGGIQEDSAVCFVSDSWGTRIALRKALALENPSCAVGRIYNSFGNAHPAGDCVGSSELLNFCPSSGLACEEPGEVPVCPRGGQAAEWGTTGLAPRTLSW